MQQELLIKENWILAEEQLHRNDVGPQEVANSLAPLSIIIIKSRQYLHQNYKFQEILLLKVNI